MNKIIRGAPMLAIVSLLAAVTAVGQAEERYTIQVTVKDSAAEQVALARSLINGLRTATTQADRRAAIATAAETLEVVPRVWPKERVHVINAAILEADLFMMSNTPQDALRVLERAEPIAKNARGAAAIHLRMGRAYARLHDYARAEAVLVAAEREAPAEGQETVFAAQLDLADVLSRNNRPIEAAARYRLLANDPTLDLTNQAQFLMRSAREHLRAGNKPNGRSDLDGVLAKAKSRGRTADEVRIQADLERESKALRAKHGL